MKLGGFLETREEGRGGKRFSGAHLYAHSPLSHGCVVKDVQAPSGDQAQPSAPCVVS